MATAYTIRYGSEKAGFGPGVETFVSILGVFDVAEGDSEGREAGGGGGSITEEVEGTGDGFETGSGKAGIASSAEDVSIVMFFVEGGDCRRV